MAMPWAVERTISSPFLVIAHVDQFVIFFELDGDDAALHGRLYALSSVFFTRPLRVAMIR